MGTCPKSGSGRLPPGTKNRDTNSAIDGLRCTRQFGYEIATLSDTNRSVRPTERSKYVASKTWTRLVHRFPKPKERSMSSSSLFRIARWPAGILAILASATLVQAQQSTLQVRVIDRNSRPVQDAQ